ncbi:MAG TPA: DUF1385 domain-containing protein [Candidatus Limnocylindria bacterium]|nr:DUF1385 domain-containing protein [Candidatus Limnocylindria bacterium]
MTAHPAPIYGGQALVEGVLIRSGSRWAVALRAPSGEIHAYDGELAPPGGLWRLPFLRGLRALGTQLRLGVRALSDSSMLADTGEIRPIPMLATLGLVAVSLVIGLSVFSAIPLLLTGRDPLVEPSLPQRLSEGMIKGTLLAAYVVGVTRLPRYRRIFSYHGAEHMAIACAEAGRALTVANVSRFNPAHPRCGTGFLVILAAVDTVLLAALPRMGHVADLGLRVAFVPVTATIAYELLRWGAKRRGLGFALNRFGLLTQRLSTSYPDAQQIEVAIAAVEACRTGVRVESPIDAVTVPAAGLPYS